MKEGKRFSSPRAQAAWRARAVRAVDNGDKKLHVARRFGVTRQTLYNWLSRHRQGGVAALATRARGRIRRRVLEPWQEEQVARAIRTQPPWTVQPHTTRWTKSAVSAYVERHFGVRFSAWQVDRHLRSFGFSSQKEVRRAFMSDPAGAGRAAV